MVAERAMTTLTTLLAMMPLLTGTLIAQCQNPPLLGPAQRGWVPMSTVRFSISSAFSTAEKDAVKDAITDWAANSTVIFVEASSNLDLTVLKSNLGGNIAGALVGATYDNLGYLTGTGIAVTTDTNLVSTPTGVFKAVIHELGHTLGLDDHNGTNGSSVMNVFSGQNDAGGNIPLAVTNCDSNQAAAASPPPDRDSDGFGDEMAGGTDCDDEDEFTFPGAFELCNDGIDNDCNGLIDGDDNTVCGSNGCPLVCDEATCSECLGQSSGNYVDENCVCMGSGGEESPVEPGTPIIIDLGQNGLQLTSREEGVHFDLNANGVKELTSWTASNSNDAFLVLDLNLNGEIDDGRELFGGSSPQPPNAFPNGFLALAEYDQFYAGGNADGIIDAADGIYSRLQLWRDANHDGVSQLWELSPLSHAISEIELRYHESRWVDRSGNELRYRSRVFLRGERGRLMRFAIDVILVSR